MAPKHMGDQCDVSTAHIIPGEGRSRRTRSTVAPPVLDLTSESEPEDSESDHADHTDHTDISEDDSEDDEDDEDDAFSSLEGTTASRTSTPRRRGRAHHGGEDQHTTASRISTTTAARTSSRARNTSVA